MYIQHKNSDDGWITELLNIIDSGLRWNRKNFIGYQFAGRSEGFTPQVEDGFSPISNFNSPPFIISAYLIQDRV